MKIPEVHKGNVINEFIDFFPNRYYEIQEIFMYKILVENIMARDL